MAALPTSDAPVTNAEIVDDDPNAWRISVQYVTDEEGNRTHVIIPNDQFEQFLDDLEDLWCTRMMQAAKREGGTSRPFREVLAEWGDDPDA